MSDLPIRRMPPITQRVDHRVLEVCAAPPSNEIIRLSAPALPFQERRDGLSKPLLHIDDGAVLVEGEDFYLPPQDIKRLNHTLLHASEASIVLRITYAIGCFQLLRIWGHPAIPTRFRLL